MSVHQLRPLAAIVEAERRIKHIEPREGESRMDDLQIPAVQRIAERMA